VDTDDAVLWYVEGVVAEIDVAEDFDVVDDFAVWARTENCAWFWPFSYPALLAEAYIIYFPCAEFVGKLNESTYAPDWSDNTS
jgi:hypothetical protein